MIDNTKTSTKVKPGNNRGGRPAHKPNDTSKAMVMEAIGMGMEQTMIAILLDVCPKTLRKFYRDELDTGKARANMTVAKSLYGRAISGKDTIASIFWLKARDGWQDTQKTVHEGLPEKISVTFALKAPDSGPIIEATPVVDLIEQK